MALIFRSMRKDTDGLPTLGRGAKHLGVRVNGPYKDIVLDATGKVIRGGMSVAPNWQLLPPHRIPVRLIPKCPEAAGSNQYWCWCHGSGKFRGGAVSTELKLVVSSPDHGTVEPTAVIPLADYEAHLGWTRNRWVIDET